MTGWKWILDLFLGHLSIIKYLIQNGAEVNAKNMYNSTPLNRAAAFGNSVDAFLWRIENNLDFVRLGHLDVVKIFIENEANVNKKTSYTNSALISAAGSGNWVFRFVKEWKFISILIRSGNLDIVKFLIENGADVNTKDDFNGETSLHYAAFGGNKNNFSDAMKIMWFLFV